MFRRVVKSKAFIATVGVLVVAFIGIQFVPVEGVGENPTARFEVDAPADVKLILQESCYDCHSNETKWPFYSRIAPGSWLMAKDVEEGREQLNISTWGEYEDVADIEFAKESMWDSIEDGSMPLWFYIPLHPSAALTDEEKAKLKAWLLAHQDEDEDEDEKPAGAGGATGTSENDGAGGSEGDEESEGHGGSKGADAEEEADDPKASEESAKAGSNPPTSKDTPKSVPTPPKQAKQPASPKPEPRKEPTPEPKKAVSDPCRAKSFKFGSVKAACEKGGVPQAKAMMKSLVKKGKDKGASYKCSSCHVDQKTYDNKPNAVADLRKLMKAVAN